MSTYNYSSKKQGSCKKIALQLGEPKHFKLVKFSTTRYQRHLSNALRALITNWRSIAVHLHGLAHQAVCITKAQRAESLTLQSPLADFMGRSFLRKFAGYQRMYTIGIIGVAPHSTRRRMNWTDRDCWPRWFQLENLTIKTLYTKRRLWIN